MNVCACVECIESAATNTDSTGREDSVIVVSLYRNSKRLECKEMMYKYRAGL